MKEMNNLRVESEDNNAFSKNIAFNIQETDDLKLTSNILAVKKSVKESTLKNIKCFEIDSEQNQSNFNSCKNSKLLVQSNKDISLSSVTSASFFKSKKLFIPSNIGNESKKFMECEMKSVKENLTENIYTNNATTDSKVYVSCRFCKKGFETLDIFNIHDCSKGKVSTNVELYKCKFCSLTFTHKQHLTTHIKGHNRNNCTLCNAQFAKHKAARKHLRIVHNIKEPEKKYNCSFCDKQFRRRLSLNLHLKIHANNKFFCVTCGFMCDDEDNYNEHIKKHIKISKYECHLCQKKFVRQHQYYQHTMAHERCSSCNITFCNKKLFLKHQHSVHHTYTEKKHTCSICKKIFLRPKHLEVHQLIHTGEKPVVKCSHCEKNFSDNKSLTKHMKTVKHLQRVNEKEGQVIEIEKSFLCSKCGMRFYRQQSLLRHIEIIHSTSEFLKCPQCDYKTKCKTNFKRHVELHTDIKRFICELCGSSFRALATLKEHQIFVHSENREFICNNCNKGFKNKSTLQRHMRIHSENRPYKCYCNRDYKRMSHLKRHMVSAHDMTLKKNHVATPKENADLTLSVNDENVTALIKSLKTLPDETSCDDFLVSVVPNSYTASTELKDLNINRDECKEELCLQSEVNKNAASPLNAIQTIIDNSEDHISNNPENALITYDLTSCERISPTCMLSNPQTSDSLNESDLSLSPTNYCNSSHLGTIPTESITTLSHSITSQDMLSLTSFDNIRPQSLPNLNFQTSSNIDSFATFSLPNSDSPTSIQMPSFLLNSDISSPSQVIDINLEHNSAPQLFGESVDILSIPSYTSSSEFEANYTPEQLFNSTRNIELWDTDENSNKLKTSNKNVAANACVNTNFSTSLTCNDYVHCRQESLLPHTLFSNDSSMVCSMDASTLNVEFDALSNLC